MSVVRTEPNTRQDKTQPKWVPSGQNGLENEWAQRGNTKYHQSAGLQGFTVPSLHSTQPSPEHHTACTAHPDSLTALQIYFGIVFPSLALLMVTSKLGKKIMFQDAKDVAWSMGRGAGSPCSSPTAQKGYQGEKSSCLRQGERPFWTDNTITNTRPAVFGTGQATPDFPIEMFSFSRT